MYRAVKVVRREDFEYERTFEREFEGIQRYEKVSQNHPGLVSVLHVGREDAAGFYYYAMELADSESGDPVEASVEGYRPRTLSSDLRRRSVRSPRECVDLGVALAEALGHLHQAGLTHRDVKPSNIIYVNGQPKLADVGLVASSGQRTFVGTEGYVPPEGPGTSSADLYSLAMVLYEMHTGKDRLDFPELPTNLEIPPSVNRDEWRALNAAICRAGSPDPRKRFDSAREFARALETVCSTPWKAPEPKRGVLPALFGTFAALGVLALAGGGGYWLWLDHQSFVGEHGPLLAERGKGVNGSGIRPAVGPVGPIGTIDEAPGEGPDEVPAPASGKDSSSDGKGATEPKTSPETDEAKAADPGKTEDPANPAPKTEEPKETPEPQTKENPTPPTESTTVSSPPKPEGGAPEPRPSESLPIVVEVVRGQVKVTSDPPAARVFHEGRELGVTETRLLEFEVGPVELVLKREGYRDYVHVGEVREGTQVVRAMLLPDLGPAPGLPWTNSLGVDFLPGADGPHRSVAEVGVRLFDRFLEETEREIPRGGVNGIAQVPEDRAVWQFCDWLTEKERRSGHLGPREYYRPLRSAERSRSDAFSLEVSRETGTLVLNTEPSGAKVYRDGAYLGETPTILEGLRLGAFELQLFKPGYEVATAMGELAGTEASDLVVALERDDSAVFGEPWTNSLGMAMVPVGDLLVAAAETPLRSYLAYLSERGVFLDPAAAAIGLNFPASGVGYDEAAAFCEWLTERERALDRIRPWQRYRLPTDLEWSRLAGLPAESGATPEQRSRAGDGSFPWGAEWPPPPGAGNFADLSAAGYFGGSVIEGYSDGFEKAAPVGSFGPSPLGLYDLSGNVWEWVSDYYSDESGGLRVVRGGGWNSSEREVLASAYRNPVPADAREAHYGFRYVLEDLGDPD
jgi:serine/threonine protein kinase